MKLIGTTGRHLRPHEEKSPKVGHRERDYQPNLTTERSISAVKKPKSELSCCSSTLLYNPFRSPLGLKPLKIRAPWPDV
jgi:ribosomal protein L28